MKFEYDLTEPRTLFIGRFQPLHIGHETLIRTALDKGEKVLVKIRRMNRDSNNPYTYAEVWQMFYKRFKKEMEDTDLVVGDICNIIKVAHGRKVGWEIEQIHLPKETEAISATKIRNGDLDNRS